MQQKHRTKGVLLIICLLVLVALTGISLTVVSSSTTANKANSYNSFQAQAQQNAVAVLHYAISTLIPGHVSTCAVSNVCDIGNSTNLFTTLTAPTASVTNPVWKITLPSSVFQPAATSAQLSWWKTYGQPYPNTSQIQGGNTNAVASFIVNQEALTADASGYPVRTLRVVAYATDATASVAAVKQQFYTYTANCQAVAPYATSLTTTCQNSLNNNDPNYCGNCKVVVSACGGTAPKPCPVLGATTWFATGYPNSCPAAAAIGWGGVQVNFIYQIVAPQSGQSYNVLSCCSAAGVNLANPVTCR